LTQQVLSDFQICQPKPEFLHLFLQDLNFVPPVFSVIIPAYNREKTIGRAIDSVLAQSFTDFELIVVNDGSIDGTAEIVRSIEDDRIYLISYEKNKGAVHAFNTGIAAARGTYISFLGSDDAWLPLMLERQYAKYISDPEIGCVYACGVINALDGTKFPWYEGTLEGYIYKEVLELGYLGGGAAMSAKKICLEEICPLDGIFSAGCNDQEIGFQLAKRFKIGLIPEVLVNVYLDAGNQISNRFKKGWLYLFLKHSDDIVEYCGAKVLARHFLKASSYLLNESNYNLAAARQAMALALCYRASPINIFRFMLLKFVPGFLSRRRPVIRLLKHLVRGRF
jgi:glycosyltransferase involved in cell wall biosynthesis